MVENALQSGLLGCALEMLSSLLTALEEGMEDALAVLLPIDVLQLLTSVLVVWTARLRAEDADFGGGRAAAESSSSSAAAQATAAAAADAPPPQPPPRVAAEVTPEVLAEALHLLNMVAACEMGCAALGGCGAAKTALLELLAATDDAATQQACVTVLASVDDVEALLLGSAIALEHVLGVLAAARDGVRVGAEEQEAAWSLISRSLRWAAGAAAPQPAELLDLLCERAELLADGRWETGSGAVVSHQRFVLGKLRGLLEGGAVGSSPAQQHALTVIVRRLDGQR